MVWCPLGNKEILVGDGYAVEGSETREFSLEGMCSDCEKDFGVASRHRRYGLPSDVMESELLEDDRFAQEYLLAVLVNTDEAEVLRCEIDQVL